MNMEALDWNPPSGKKSQTSDSDSGRGRSANFEDLTKFITEKSAEAMLFNSMENLHSPWGKVEVRIQPARGTIAKIVSGRGRLGGRKFQ